MSRQKPVVISRGVLLNAKHVQGCIHAPGGVMCFLLMDGLQGLCVQNSLNSSGWNCMGVENFAHLKCTLKGCLLCSYWDLIYGCALVPPACRREWADSCYSRRKYKARPQHLFWLYCSVWPGLWAECRAQLLCYCWVLNWKGVLGQMCS